MPNQTPLNPDALEAACDAVEGIRKDYDVELFTAENVAEIVLRAYLAVAQPVVNSVEEIPAQVQVISWEEEPEHECWKLAPDETFVGLIVKSDRAWSPAGKYTLNIQRPEVDDG